MPRVAIINAKEDAVPAGLLADELRALGLEADANLDPQDLRDAVQHADVAIAVWSPLSREIADLIAAAQIAHARDRLVHVCIVNAQTPNAFAFAPAIDLAGWRGEPNFPPWRRLLDAISEILYTPAPEDNSAFVMPTPPPVEAATKGAGLFDTFEPLQAEPERGPPPIIPRYRPVPMRDPRVSTREHKSARAVALIALVFAIGAGGAAYFSSAPMARMDKVDVVAAHPLPAPRQTTPTAIAEAPERVVQAELRPTRPARERARPSQRVRQTAARAEQRAPARTAEQRYAAMAPADRPSATGLATSRQPDAPAITPRRERRSSGEVSYTYFAPSPPPPVIIVEERPRRRRPAEPATDEVAAPLPDIPGVTPTSAEAEEAARRERRLRREQRREQRQARAERMQRDLGGPLGGPLGGSLGGLGGQGLAGQTLGGQGVVGGVSCGVGGVLGSRC